MSEFYLCGQWVDDGLPSMEEVKKRDKIRLCQHNWVYEDMILCSNPPQQRRICRLCGKMETVTIGTCQMPNSEYQELFKKFHQ